MQTKYFLLQILGLNDSNEEKKREREEKKKLNGLAVNGVVIGKFHFHVRPLRVVKIIFVLNCSRKGRSRIGFTTTIIRSERQTVILKTVSILGLYFLGFCFHFFFVLPFSVVFIFSPFKISTFLNNDF